MQTKTRLSGAPRSLTSTLALAFAGLSLLVLLVAGILQLLFAIQTQQASVANQQQRIAEDAGRTVASFLQERLTILTTTAKVADPVSASPEVARQELQSLLGLESAFRQVVLLNSRYRELASVSRLPEQSVSSITTRINSEAIDQIRQGKTYISPVYIDPESSEPLVVMAVPVSDPLGESKSILAAEVNLKFMWDLVDQLKVGDTGTAYLVDRQGKLLAFHDTSRVLQGENVANLPEVSEFILGKTNTQLLDLAPGINKNLTVGAFAPLVSPDWALITELPWQEAYAPFIQNALASILITIALAVLAALAGIYLARRLTVPLVTLRDTATRITAGELSLQAPIQGTSEIAGLASAFNSMTTQLRQTLQGLEQRVAERTQALESSNAELEASRNQLQSSNQELQASRDQLQAGNAELAANRDQLQANNRELEAKQNELAKINQALEQTTRDLQTSKSQLELAYSAMERNSAYLAALNDTAMGLMGRMDVDALLGTIMNRAAGLVGTAHGYVYLLNPGEQEMQLRVGMGLYDDLVGSIIRQGSGLTGTVWETGEPMVVNDYRHWNQRLTDSRRAALRAVVGVPLKYGNAIRGVIGLASTEPDFQFDEERTQVLARFAQLASIALENADLFDKSEQQVAELSALNKIGEIVSAAQDLPTLTTQLGDQLLELFSVRHVYIALYDAATNQIELPYVINDGERTSVPPMEMGEGLASVVIKTRQPLLLNENTEARAAELGSRYVGPPAKSYLGVPILSGDRAIGVLSIQSLDQEGRFGGNEIRLLSTIAANLSVAIAKVRLNEQTQKALKDTERSAERERVVAQELQVLTQRLTGEGWTKYLEHEPANLWIEDSNSDLNGGHREIPEMARAEQLGAPVVSRNGEHSAMAVPILLRGQVIGTIGLEDFDPTREWNEDELSIVREVSENVALALDNARLYDESQRRVSELDALNSLSQAVTTELELQNLLTVIGEQLQQIFDIQNVYIALYDRVSEMISLPFFVNDRQRVTVDPIPFGEGITSHIIRTREPLVLNRNAEEEMALLGAKTLGNPARSFLGVPIFVGDDVTGVISIQSTAREDAFDESSLRLMETIAASVGASIQNAQLYGAMQQEVVTRQRAEQEIKLSLQEKEVLLKEIHHRVKNNLQIITSLLNLQSAQLKDPDAISMFRESQSRVRSMALIHEKLYQSKDLARIDFDGYVKDLMVYLFRSYAANPEQIRTHIATNNMYLAIDTAIPCGLIISELVTNTIKYGFPNGKRGDLHISLGPEDDGHLTLIVEDNGVGLPEDFDWRESDSLGLQLVDTLTSQLHGKIQVNGKGGTSFRITFPG